MFKKMLVVVALSALSVTAFAGDYEARQDAEKTIELQDGSTLYVYKGGKMAVETKFGKVNEKIKSGAVLKAKDGQEYILNGNELARLDYLLRKTNN